jgi:pilus assembly protein CpaC
MKFSSAPVSIFERSRTPDSHCRLLTRAVQNRDRKGAAHANVRNLVLALSLILFSGNGLLRAATEPEQITITVGKSFVIDTPGDMERVAVATEDVVEAVAITQREVVLNGKAPGETSVLIWQKNGGGRLAYDVTVEPSKARDGALHRRLAAELGDSIQGDLDDKTVMLRGQVRSQADGDKAMAIASAFGTPVNLMTIATPATAPQILLKVRFANVDRSASLSLGANIISTGAANTTGSITTGQFASPTTTTIASGAAQTFSLSNALNVFLFRPDLNLGATIEALQTKGLVEILAEPNVLAADGKAASFLAGGEFPFPVVQSSANGINNVTIQFREFGIRLNFTPTVTPRGTIKLEVNPEVSSLDYTNGLTYAGFNIPGLDVRRVKTEIELENNQSFAIAGLIDNMVTENLSKVPGLGDIPLLGKLFQSKSVTRNNTELLVVVTPELVQPIPAGAQPQVVMPGPFLKDGPTKLPDSNVPDANQLPKQPQMPFEPSSNKAPAQSNVPATSLTNDIKGVVRSKDMQP